MTLTWTMSRKIQIAAVQIVIRVNASPAFEPNGLDPPTPPKAPARPPPLPLWIRTRPMRNRPSRITTRLSKLANIVDCPVPAFVRAAVSSKYTFPWDGEQAKSRHGRPHDCQE